MGRNPKVYIVGAGPGDPSLITLKGLSAIKEADCILYDELIPKELLRFAEAELIPVGKRKGMGKGRELQRKIFKIIERKVKEGKIVVRLKGGDPFIFGRGGEEAEFLSKKKIPFEVIPGVTALSAVPAYAGIPLTHRNYSSQVALVTCHEAEEGNVDWDAISKFKGTVVIFMGATNLEKVKEKFSHEKKFVAVTMGTTPKQKVKEGKIKELKKLETPSLIIIGDVVKLRKKLKWFEKKPLFGKKVVVVRPDDGDFTLEYMLRELGADVKLINPHKIEFRKVSFEDIRKALSSQWLVFTSKNGVKSFFWSLKRLGLDARALGKIACIGKSTAESLKEHGIVPDIVPEKFVAEELLRMLLNKKPKSVTIIGLNKLIPRKLKENGVEVKVLETYMLRKLNIEDPGEADAFVFTSKSSACAFKFREFENAKVICMGPKTAEVFPFKVITPKEHTYEALFEEVKRALR